MVDGVADTGYKSVGKILFLDVVLLTMFLTKNIETPVRESGREIDIWLRFGFRCSYNASLLDFANKHLSSWHSHSV